MKGSVEEGARRAERGRRVNSSTAVSRQLVPPLRLSGPHCQPAPPAGVVPSPPPAPRPCEGPSPRAQPNQLVALGYGPWGPLPGPCWTCFHQLPASFQLVGPGLCGPIGSRPKGVPPA